jgi:hypothetical protein
MSPTQAHNGLTPFRRWIRRALRGIILVAAGLFLWMVLPGARGIRALFSTALDSIIYVALFLPFYFIPAMLVGEIMAWVGRVRSTALALFLGAVLGAAMGISTEFAVPPHRNPLPKLVSRPVFEKTVREPSAGSGADAVEPSTPRLVRRWISVNWTTLFFFGWFAAWALHEHRRIRPAPATRPE